MNKTNIPTRSRWLTRLSAPLAGLALLATGIGAAQAHDFDHYRHHGRDDMHRAFHRDHDHYRDHDRRDYRHDRYGWRGEHRDRDHYDHRRYGYDHRYDHRYARDGRRHDDDDRGVFGRW